MRTSGWTWVGCAAALWASVCRAEGDGAPVAASAPEKLTLSFEPWVWFVAPGGDFRYPRSGGGAVPLVNLGDLNMDSPRVTPGFELNVNQGRWGGTVRFFAFGSEDRGSTFSTPLVLGDTSFEAGTPIRTSLDFTDVEVEGRYRVVPEDGWMGTGRAWPTDRYLDVVFGARLIDFEMRSEQDTGEGVNAARANESFAMPLVGLKGGFEAYRDAVETDNRFTLDLQTTFAFWPGNRHAFVWDIMPGFVWRPVANVGVQAGYRQLLIRLRDSESDFEWSGALAGLYFGVVVRF